MNNTTSMQTKWYNDANIHAWHKNANTTVDLSKTPLCVEVIGRKGAGRHLIAKQILDEIKPALHIPWHLALPFDEQSSLEDLAYASVRELASRRAAGRINKQGKQLSRYLEHSRPVEEWRGIFRKFIGDCVKEYANPLVEIIFSGDCEDSDDLSMINGIVTRFLFAPGISVISLNVSRWIRTPETVNHEILQLPEVGMDHFISLVERQMAERDPGIDQIFSQFNKERSIDNSERRWEELIVSVEYPDIEATDQLLRYISLSPYFSDASYTSPDSAIQSLFLCLLFWKFPKLAEMVHRDRGIVTDIKTSVLSDESSVQSCLSGLGYDADEKQIKGLKSLFRTAFDGTNPLVLPFEESARFSDDSSDELFDRIASLWTQFEEIDQEKTNGPGGDNRPIVRAAINEFRLSILNEIKIRKENNQKETDKQGDAMQDGADLLYGSDETYTLFLRLVRKLLNHIIKPQGRYELIQTLKNGGILRDPDEFLPEEFRTTADLIREDDFSPKSKSIKTYKEALDKFFETCHTVKADSEAFGRVGMVEAYADYGIATNNPFIIKHSLKHWKQLIEKKQIDPKKNSSFKSLLKEASKFINSKGSVKAFVSYRHINENQIRRLLLSDGLEWWKNHNIELVGDQRLIPKSGLPGQRWEYNVYRHLPCATLVIVPQTTPEYFKGDGVQQELELIRSLYEVQQLQVLHNCRDGNDMDEAPGWLQAADCTITTKNGQNKSDHQEMEDFKRQIIEKVEKIFSELSEDIGTLLPFFRNLSNEIDGFLPTF